MVGVPVGYRVGVGASEGVGVGIRMGVGAGVSVRVTSTTAAIGVGTAYPSAQPAANRIAVIPDISKPILNNFISYPLVYQLMMGFQAHSM